MNSRYEGEKKKWIQDMKVKRRSEFKIWGWKEEVNSRYEGEKKKWIQDMKVKRRSEFKIWRWKEVNSRYEGEKKGGIYFRSVVGGWGLGERG